MRFLEIPYLCGRSRCDKRLYDLPHARIIAARRQLPVRERTRPALAELHVGRRVKYARLPKTRNVLRAPVNILPALQNKRRSACTCERPCREDACRAETNDNGTVRAVRSRPAIRNRKRLLSLRRCNIRITARACAHDLLIRRINIDGIIPYDRCSVPPPRVQGLMNDNHPVHGTG